MSAHVTIEQRFLTKLHNAGVEGDRLAKASVTAIADMIVRDAKVAAPADLGAIRQGIGREIVGQGDQVHARIFASAPESAYQEFGTGGKVQVPVAMADVAAQFQGASGGDMAAFILALTGWVKRHGLTGVYSVKTHRRNTRLSNTDDDEKAAWAIARSILKNGLKPQPYLYPAYIANNWKLLPMLQTSLKKVLGTLS